MSSAVADLLEADTRKPTPHQDRALQELLEWWNLPQDHPQWQNCVLQAPAGCGKTFLAKYFTGMLKDALPVFTATTNEAAKQLALAGVDVWGTIHSALGLVKRNNAEQTYFVQNQIPEDIYEYNLLVIDEASMAGIANPDDENTYPLIVDYVIELGMRTLWLGDPYQLPPVEAEDGISPVFTQGWRTVTLSEIMRNSGDILEYCTKLRSIIDMQSRTFPRAPKCATVHTISHTILYRALRNAEKLEELRKGTTRIIVWKNSNADRINNFIRIGLHGDELARKYSLLPTDQVLFTAPVFWGNFPEDPDHLDSRELQLKATVNTRAEVISTQQTTLYGLAVFRCKFRLEEGGEILGYVLTDEGKARFEKLKKAFIKSIEAAGARKKADSWVWWHTFDSCFVKLKHSYAITCHRSQGSNIPNVIVDVKDILSASWKQPLLAYKLVYTACSRTKQHLTLVREL